MSGSRPQRHQRVYSHPVNETQHLLAVFGLLAPPTSDAPWELADRLAFENAAVAMLAVAAHGSSIPLCIHDAMEEALAHARSRIVQRHPNSWPKRDRGVDLTAPIAWGAERLLEFTTGRTDLAPDLQAEAIPIIKQAIDACYAFVNHFHKAHEAATRDRLASRSLERLDAMLCGIEHPFPAIELPIAAWTASHHASRR